MKKAVSKIMLILLLTGTLKLIFNIQPVNASGTIYIRADGSIDPSDAPLQRDGDVYTLTSNITSDSDGIVVERSNIIIDGDGYMLQGVGSGNGVSYGDIENVTIENVNVQGFYCGIAIRHSHHNNLSRNNVTESDLCGIYFEESSNNDVSGSNLKNNKYGMYLCEYSNNNKISGNNITSSAWVGIHLGGSNNNRICRNNITDAREGGVSLWDCSDNSVSENNVVANYNYGIFLFISFNNVLSGNNIANDESGVAILDSSNNILSSNNITSSWTGTGIAVGWSDNNCIFHNNFVDNFRVVEAESSSSIWDDGYPSGGNYWSDYSGVDIYNGPGQNETGIDRIGDIPYTIDENNQDNYPLMSPFPCIHAAAIKDIRPNKTVIGQGFTAYSNVDIANQGHFPETFNITVYVNTSIIATTTNIKATNRNFTTTTFTWNTSGFAYGNYTLWAYVWPVLGETYTEDNSFIYGRIVVTILGDTNGDGTVNFQDAIVAGLAFGSQPSDSNWNPNTDINEDSYINFLDVILMGQNFGQSWT